MPRFAANLSMLYPELEFLDRFEAAARDGFQGVEFLFPYACEAGELAARLKAHGLQQVLFNAPPGAWEQGERGLACLLPAGAQRDAVRPTYVSNLRWAAAEAARAGLDILIEPINTRDIPGFFLNRQDQAHELIGEIGAANVKVQMDLYHCQIVEGDVAMKIRRYLPTGRVGHFQIAGVPERHEPDVGEMNYAYLFGVIDEVARQCGWDGWIGCEYRPRRGAQPGGTSAGLGWF